jgi:hypothetical protein
VANIGNLSAQISRELQRYSNLVAEELETAKEEVSDDLVDELKQTSPEKTGSYRKGWRKKKVGKKIVVHNKTDYQLTHLLEKGHAKAIGGRVPAKIHIAPAEEKAMENFINKVEQAIRQ